MNKRIYFLLTSFFLSSIQIFSQENNTYRFSLEEAVAFAIENNRQSQNAQRDIDAAKRKKRETTAIGFPQVNAKVDYQNFLKQQVTLIPAQFFGGNPGDFIETTFGTKQSMNASASVSQLIFDGSYLVGLQSAKVYLQISELAKQKSDIEIRKMVVDAYANVLLSEESIRILKENKRVLEKNLNESKAIFENGMGEEESVEQLQITLSNIRNNLNRTERLYDLSRKMLNIALGIDLEEKVELKDHLEQLTQNALIELSGKETNFDPENNIDYIIAKNEVRSKELLLKYEKSAYLPKLSAFVNGGYNAYSNTFSFLDTSQKWFGSALLGVSLEIPIFSSGIRSSKVKQAKIEWIKSRNNFDLTKQQLLMEHHKVSGDLQFAVEEYMTLKQNLALAERIENKNQIKHAQGLASSFDLRQAQLQLYTAQQDFLQSMINVLNQKEALKALQINN